MGWAVTYLAIKVIFYKLFSQTIKFTINTYTHVMQKMKKK